MIRGAGFFRVPELCPVVVVVLLRLGIGRVVFEGVSRDARVVVLLRCYRILLVSIGDGVFCEIEVHRGDFEEPRSHDDDDVVFLIDPSAHLWYQSFVILDSHFNRTHPDHHSYYSNY